MVSQGSPNQRHLFSDLAQDDVWFIHRQSGSRKRFLLESMFARQQIALSLIHGCDVEVLTHAAVAADVASGLADAGVGLEPSARREGLDFLPMLTKRYVFIGSEAALDSPQVASMVALLCGDNFCQQRGALPGDDATDCGTVQN